MLRNSLPALCMMEYEVKQMITYDLGNLADWLAALGTISAVIVALYLSRKDEKPRARVKSTFSYGVTYDGKMTEHPIHISMEIVNIGKVPINLEECTVSPSMFSKEKMYFTDESHKVKKLLNPGEFYEHKLDYEVLNRYLASKKSKKLKTYMFFRDSLDNKYKCKIILRA